MPKIELFELPLEAAATIESPEIEETMMLVDAIFEAYDELDFVEPMRFELEKHAEAFAKNAAIMALLNEKGAAVLPITLVDGQVMKSGAYPTLEEFGDYAGIVFSVHEPDEEGCGCGDHGHEGCNGHGGCGCGHHH